MAETTGSSQAPFNFQSNNRNNQQIPHQNAGVMARIAPALDAKNPHITQDTINRIYPQSVPLSSLDTEHSGTIRMFMPERYLPPQGTYYNSESPDVEIPDNTGGMTKRKPNRCRTCHKLLSDHRPAQTNHRGDFSCPAPCAFARLCPSHPEHPNRPCPQLYIKPRVAQRMLGIFREDPWPADMQVYPSEPEWMILKANGYVNSTNTRYDAGYDPPFTQKALSLDNRGPGPDSMGGTYKYIQSDLERAYIHGTNQHRLQNPRPRHGTQDNPGQSHRTPTPHQGMRAPQHDRSYASDRQRHYQPPPPQSPYMQAAPSPYMQPAGPYAQYPPGAYHQSPYMQPPPVAYPQYPPGPFYQPAPSPYLPPAYPYPGPSTGHDYPREAVANQGTARTARPNREQQRSESPEHLRTIPTRRQQRQDLSGLSADTQEYIRTGNLPRAVRDDFQSPSHLRRRDVHARSRHAVTTAEHAVNDAIQAREINRDMANHIRQQSGLPPIEPHNFQVKGSAKRAREEDHATEQPRSYRRRVDLAPDRTQEFEDEAKEEYSGEPRSNRRRAEITRDRTGMFEDEAIESRFYRRRPDLAPERTEEFEYAGTEQYFGEPRSNRRRSELAPDLTEEFEDEANRLPDSRRASPARRRTDTFSRVTDTTQALLYEFEEEGAREEYE